MSSLTLLSHHYDVILAIDLLKGRGRKRQLDKWHPIIIRLGFLPYHLI